MEIKQTNPVNKYPVMLEGDTITCYVLFHPAFLGKNAEWEMTYADACCAGIKKYWEEAGFSVDIRRIEKGNKRPHICVVPAKMTNTSYVMSRWWRWGWGLFRSSFHPESFMINWSRRHPGNIHLNLRRKYTKDRFMRVAAHEFGHHRLHDVVGVGLAKPLVPRDAVDEAGVGVEEATPCGLVGRVVEGGKDAGSRRLVPEMQIGHGVSSPFHGVS